MKSARYPTNAPRRAGLDTVGQPFAKVANMRGRLVQHAIGKCERCGSTLCADPLGHRCDIRFPSASNFQQAIDRMAVDPPVKA